MLRRRATPFLCVAAVLGLALYGVSTTGRSQQPPQQRPAPEQGQQGSGGSPDTARDDQEAAKPSPSINSAPADVLQPQRPADAKPSGGEPEKDWWDKVRTDPNAAFAGAVAIFTLALVIVGGWQARRLRQTVEATKLAAEAATQAATAAVAAERARFFVVIDETNFETTIDLVERVGTLHDHRLRVQCRFRNYGKTPGIISEVSTGFSLSPRAEAHRAFTVDPHSLRQHMIGSGDFTEPQHYMMERELLIQEGSDILADTTKIWFYGQLTYRTIFDEHDRVHRFRFWYTRNRDGVRAMRLHDYQNT